MNNYQHKKVWYAPNKFESYGQEEIDAVTECLKEGWLAGFGPKTVNFEEKVSTFFGKKYGVFVNSGSSACLLAIASLDYLPPGSEVITPACTFSTTLAPILQLGYKPVFCDVGLNTYVATTEDVVSKITSNTRIIMLPNLIGNKPDWKAIKQFLIDNNRHDIILIEDSADTMTHTEETDISTTSFYASHIITAGGSGGMVMFNNLHHKNRALMYRDWGRIGNNAEDMSERFNYNVDGIPYDFKFLYGVLGYNMKSSEMNAAFGLVQLERFNTYQQHRRAIFERYLHLLQDTPGLVLPDDSIKPNWLAIPLQHPARLKLLHYLENNNIQTRVTFAGNVTRHPAYRMFLEPFKNADIIMSNGFLLGAHHGMSLDDVDYVCEKIRYFCNNE